MNVERVKQWAELMHRVAEFAPAKFNMSDFIVVNGHDRFGCDEKSTTVRKEVAVNDDESLAHTCMTHACGSGWAMVYEPFIEAGIGSLGGLPDFFELDECTLHAMTIGTVIDYKEITPKMFAKMLDLCVESYVFNGEIDSETVRHAWKGAARA